MAFQWGPRVVRWSSRDGLLSSRTWIVHEYPNGSTKGRPHDSVFYEAPVELHKKMHVMYSSLVVNAKSQQRLSYAFRNLEMHNNTFFCWGARVYHFLSVLRVFHPSCGAFCLQGFRAVCFCLVRIVADIKARPAVNAM